MTHDRSQDDIVESAIEKPGRSRGTEDARAWATAAADPDFRREMADLEQAYGRADAETWPE